MVAENKTVTENEGNFAFGNSPVTKYLARQIEAIKGEKTQREIAAEVGYDKPNMISMMKRGEVRVPLDKIPLLAKALHVDPAHMFRLAMEDYWPGRRDALQKVFGAIVTENERDILAEFRRHFGDKDPALSPELKRRIREAAKGYRE